MFYKVCLYMVLMSTVGQQNCNAMEETLKNSMAELITLKAQEAEYGLIVGSFANRDASNGTVEGYQYLEKLKKQWARECEERNFQLQQPEPAQTNTNTNK